MKIDMTCPDPRASLRGFTLTELLVVIVIIVSVVALSLAGLRRLRDYADKATSTRNLAQLQIANTSYASDHNGRYVPLKAHNENGARIGFWYNDAKFLSYLIGNVKDANGDPTRSAPRSYLDPKVLRARKSMYRSMSASYGMSDNGLVGQSGANVLASNFVGRIGNPSASMAFSTATDYRVTYNSRFNWKEEDNKTSDGAMSYRYGRNALVVYYDGHVEALSQSDIRAIDKRGGRNNAFWKPTAK